MLDRLPKTLGLVGFISVELRGLGLRVGLIQTQNPPNSRPSNVKTPTHYCPNAPKPKPPNPKPYRCIPHKSLSVVGTLTVLEVIASPGLIHRRRQTDRQTHRHTDRQTDRQIDR